MVARCMRASMVERHELDPKLIDIERAVGECIDMVKMGCGLRDIDVGLSVKSGVPPVTVDEIHLQQVVLNLLRSAMEAIENGGGARVISISVALNQRDEIQVEVARHRRHRRGRSGARLRVLLFDSRRAAWAWAWRICRKLIEAHGGMLRAAHNPEEGGALFRSLFLSPQCGLKAPAGLDGPVLWPPREPEHASRVEADEKRFASFFRLP